jgi:hypothetical protein
MPATGGAPDQHTDTPSPPHELVPGTRWRRVFPGEERQLGQLRRWLFSLLPDSPARDDLAVVVTELGTNAIRHTASGEGGWLVVEITWHGPVVRVAVADNGGLTEPRVIEDPTADHGRGLLLVRGLSLRTGVCGDHRGRLVWADVLWEGMGPAAPEAGSDPHEAAIRDGEAALARRFAGVPAWFGRSTLAWWALAEPDGLVTAASAQELAGLLYRLAETAHPLESPAAGQPRQASEQRQAARGRWHPGAPRRAQPGSTGTEHRGGRDGSRDLRGRRDESPGQAQVFPGSPHRARIPLSPARGAA